MIKVVDWIIRVFVLFKISILITSVYMGKPKLTGFIFFPKNNHDYNQKITLSTIDETICCSSVNRFKENVLLGTPDTNRKGLKTRNARSAFTSNPFMILMPL